MSVTPDYVKSRGNLARSGYRISALMHRTRSMIVMRAVFLVLLIAAFTRVADAKKRTYEKGKLIDVSPNYMEFDLLRLPISPPPQILVGYSFEIQVGGCTYFVKAAVDGLVRFRSQYKPEWAVNDPIEFRFDEGKMFVKRPKKERELQARLMKVVLGTANPSLSPPPSSAPQFRPLLDEPQHGKTLPLGVDFIRVDDICLILSGYVGAGDFFDHIRARKTAGGIEFRKGAQPVETFPESVTIRVIAELGTCTLRERMAEGGSVSSSKVRLDENFMQSIDFAGSWKHGFDDRSAELGPLAEGRIPNPLPVPSYRDWWEYEFKVRSQGVSLNDALVIIMQSPDGKMIARLSTRLGSKS